MLEPLTVSVERGGDTLVIRLCGELDLATAPTLDAALGATDGSRRVLVEMWDLSFIDSSGFRVLVTAHHRLEDGGRLLALRGMPPTGREAMKALGLDKILHLDHGM